MDHATMSAAATPTINSDRFMSFSFFRYSSRLKPKADAFYIGEPEKGHSVWEG
jgi:hypothetical protein